MKNLFVLILIAFSFSCNDGDDGGGNNVNGVMTYSWDSIPDYAQYAIISSGVDTSKVIYYNQLTQSQKDTFLSLGLDSTKPYKVTQ